MKTSSIVRLTIHEHTSGQVLWIAAGVAVLMVLGVSLVSGVALGHQARMIDTASYILIDLVTFFTSTLLGAHLYQRDFTNRGIAELAVPGGMRRTTLLFARLAGHALCLAVVACLLFAVRAAGFWISDATAENLTLVSGLMLCFVVLKTWLSLCVATFLGCHTRPVISLLGTLGFFALGHFSAGVSGIQGMSESGERLVPASVRILLKVFRVWNPNHLVLESHQGVWENPALGELLGRLGWGVGAVMVFAISAALAVRTRDIDPLRF